MPALFSLPPEIFLQIISYLSASAISSLARTSSDANATIMPMLYRKNIMEGKGSALVHLADGDHLDGLRDFIHSEMGFRTYERRTLRTDNVFFSYDRDLTIGTKTQYQSRRRYQIYEHANYGPLVRAVHRGAHETVDLLVMMGWLRDVDFHNSQFSGTPLQLAVRNNHPTLVRMLLMRGARPNALVPRMDLREGSAFTEAARLGNEDIIEALTVAGAKDNVRDSHGLTAKDYLKRNKERKEQEARDRQRAREAQAEQREALARLSRAEHQFETPGTINARISATCTCGSSYFRDH